MTEKTLPGAASEALPVRLRVISRMLAGGEVVADIGTDHAYLPICLVREGKFARAVAADVREGPLRAAEEHIRAAGLSERIRTVLSDGLSALDPADIRTVVIAGMGGRLIARLVQEAYAAGKFAELSEILVQPQSEVHLARKALHAAGLRIIGEKMAEDRGKRYLMIRAVPGEERYAEEEYRYGRLLAARKDPVFYKELTYRIRQLKHVAEALGEPAEEAASREKRREEISTELAFAERMLSEWHRQPEP
jgi:tRNA (adenine22-N1)-methyltransferase